MAQLPKTETQLVDSIYRSIELEEARPLRLARIGASSIGEECLRALWLDWRAYASSTFDGRMLRLFQTGHLQEERIVQDLRRAGLEVWDKQENGEQFTYNDDTGHFVVKLDGVVRGVPGAEKTAHTLEVKTHNLKSFTELEKKGVEKAKPMHYYQMQAGMLFSGIERALYVALCKDNERYYVERVRPDEDAFRLIQQKLDSLVNFNTAPTGLSEDGSFYACKWCDMRAACLGEVEPQRTCRSCVHSEPLPNGNELWVCNVASESVSLTREAQLAACPAYEPRKMVKI